MAKVSVKLPVGMTTAAGGRTVECDAATVMEALEQAVVLEPRLKPRIFRDDGRIWSGIFLNSRNVMALDGYQTVVKDGDKLQIVPPISGG